MSMFLLHNWYLINDEIGAKLEASKNTLNDLYSVLLNAYLDNLREYYFKEEGRTEEEINYNKNLYLDLLSAANDVDQDKTRSKFYKAPPPPTERDTVNIIESYYDYLLEYDEILAEEYKKYLTDFLIRYNIRYQIHTPCKLVITIEGLLWTQFNYLKHFAKVSGSQSRTECIRMLEHHLNKIESPYEENQCINDSIKLIEHFLYERTNQATLGEALNQSGLIFPSNTAKESLRKYYEFSNDYPNIRHIGSYEPPIRNLNKSDGLLALSLAIAYSAFIIQNHKAILYGNYIKFPEENENDLFGALF
jgi:hypothetical protein